MLILYLFSLLSTCELIVFIFLIFAEVDNVFTFRIFYIFYSICFSETQTFMYVVLVVVFTVAILIHELFLCLPFIIQMICKKSTVGIGQWILLNN